MFKALSVIALVFGSLAFSQQSGFRANPHSAQPVPSKPSPAIGAKGVSRSPTLTWSISEPAASYDVYFGTSAAAPRIASTTSPSYAFTGPLKPGVTYYWRVVAKNGDGSVSSGTWSFQTAAVGKLSCDLNADGVVNAVDVQLAVNQATGKAPCGSADLNQDGACSMDDVQRVVDATLGKPCRTGP